MFQILTLNIMHCTFRNSVTLSQKKKLPFIYKKELTYKLRNTVERSRNNCCQWNATISSLFIVYDLHVSFCSLSYDRSIASCTASFPQSAILCFSFNFRYPLMSFRSSSSFLRLLPRLPATSILPPIFPATACFREQFLRKTWPIQPSFHPFIICRIFLSSLSLSNIFQHLSRCQIANIIYISINLLHLPPSSTQ